MCSFQNQNLCTITYEQVRKACDEPFGMSLVGSEAAAVVDAVNKGIDSHLEACSVKGRDTYEVEENRLCCVVSAESLPVLLRRLFEADPCSDIGSGILTSLGFNDAGVFVGREALGLE